MTEPTFEIIFDTAQHPYSVYAYHLGEATVLFIGMLERTTHQMLGCQSVVIQQGEGRIHQTIKRETMTREQTLAFWAQFQRLCQTRGGATCLYAEAPTALSAHYMNTYPGLVLSTREARLGMVAMVCQLGGGT